ncbi:MAG TPA: sodium-translocating pyrophosphatase [Flavobacteriales bacterium]|nr:sodium-translocating pyrophosphatase [Flavobacteriales bacterium]
MDFLYENLIYIIPLTGVIGLLVMAVKAAWVTKQDAGDANMQELAGYIAKGAMAFLKAEWKILSFFVIIAAGLLAFAGTRVEHSSPVIALSFIIGAVLSAFAGYIGMRIATKANVRTTQAARTSLAKALKVSFTGGTVMGLGVAGLAVFGLGGLFIIFYQMFVPEGQAITGTGMRTAIEVLTGFSLGAESIALFARVGGGIYTKAADVGADLVGKVEAGIPEDDVRNPATIADNVGDNVGDVAGMGADLFGSYVATILATMVLGQEIVSVDKFHGLAPILLPMAIAGMGLLFSIVGTWFVRIKSETSSVQAALNLGNWMSVILTGIASFGLVYWMLPETMSWINPLRGNILITKMGVFYAIVTGLVVGALMSIITEYYTAMGKRPVKSIIKQSATGHATNIIGGLAIGMESTVLPIIVLAAGIYGSFYFAGLYGVAIAAAGMMATTAMQLAIDAFGPIADNAGGIAEMSQLPEEVRHRTDNLDAVGNTTAATGKGFAIASAALTSLALFAAFVGIAGISHIDIYKADVLAGLFVGGMIPFIFSSLAIAAVGRAAMDMVNEVRRQFREIPGIMEYKAKPEYEKCVAISTKASIREMMMPGAIALIVPVIVGFAFGPEVLGGLLAGVTVSGVLMGMFQSNAGGAWDNAKKSFEKGVEIEVNGKKEIFYKKSEPHKASVTGDTVGDPFKDTSGPSMNILIKLMSIVSLVIAPHIALKTAEGTGKEEVKQEVAAKDVFADVQGAFIVNSEESTLIWEAKKTGGGHNGKVKIIEGKIEVNEGRLSGGHFTLDMTTITSDDLTDTSMSGKFIGHILGRDFFNTDTFKIAELIITSANFTPETNNYWVTGDLTIKGITKQIIFPATFKIENGELTGEAAFDIDRTRWGINYNSKTILGATADKFIYDDISFKVNIKAKK